MATRSHFAFYEYTTQDINKPSALLYRHYDGDPDDVLPELVPILLSIQKKNQEATDLEACDTASSAAKVLQSLLNKNKHNNYYGIFNKINPCIDFIYCIYPDKIRIHEWNIEKGVCPQYFEFNLSHDININKLVKDCKAELTE